MTGKRNHFPPIVWFMLFGLALAVRLYAAWCFRHTLNLDAGVVALMAKHIAEGTAFPVFFYGQAHMGSLEALFSGLFCRLFGVTGFNVCLGTVFVSLGLLPVVYFWARDAAGRFAGAVALAFVVIGPGGFFHYNASPRGAYAATLTLGTFLLWYATRMAIRWHTAREQSGWNFLWLGIAAGLAWWSSQLTTAAIVSAALLLLITLRAKAFTWRVLPGVAGFLAGSAPFWLYNAVNGWPSFAFAGTFGRVRIRDGLYWFFTDRFTSLMLPGVESNSVRALALILYIAVAVGALALLVHAYRAKQWARWYTLFGIALFTVLFSLTYASSHFAAIATPRYFLPMVAPIAVVIGLLTRQLAQWMPAPPACLPLLFLIVGQLPSLPWAFHFEQRERGQLRRIQHLADHLEAKGIDTLYARNVQRSWTFAVRESAVFVDVMGEFYHPHAIRAETTPYIAVLNNYGMVDAFLTHAGGAARRQSVGPFIVHDQFEPPTGSWQEIPSEQIAHITDYTGNEVCDLVLSARLDTEWRTLAPPGQRYLTIAFSEPVSFAGLRLYTMYSNEYPREWRVLGSNDGGSNWQELLPETPLSRYFWSGQRIYWGDPFFRQELRTEPKAITHLRIEDTSKKTDWCWSVQRIQLFKAGDYTYIPPDVDALVETLRERSIQFLFCDRGWSHIIYKASEGEIETPQDPRTFEDAPHLRDDGMALSPHTAILVPTEEADTTRTVLSDTDLHVSEVVWGNHHLFYFPETSMPDTRFVHGLMWLGYGLAIDEAIRAHTTLESAQMLFENDPSDDRIPKLLATALAKHPFTRESMLLWSEFQTLHGLPPLDDPFIHGTKAEVQFRNGVTLLGYTKQPYDEAIQHKIALRYHWQLPEHLDPTYYTVFVHICRGREILLQDDHVLLDDVPRAYIRARSSAGIFYVDRIIDLPEDIQKQGLEMRIGLVDRRTGERLRVRTDLPERRNAVTLLSL